MARSNTVRDNLQKSAWEENDHLIWCQQRITELGGRVSWLNPLWYTGSLAIGTIAGAAGDNWSLGFLAETERQVVNHLNSHLQLLPVPDLKSKAILEQMKEDEAKHATVAMKAGGVPLPKPVIWLMGGMSKIMTTTAFWL
jgi:ubiquinone biosynthesis monooxygenase Coq7